MCSNWALRSGWCEPSSALRLPWRKTQLHQFLGDRIGADRVAQRRQRVGQLVHALRHPGQRPLRITQRDRLHQPLQLRNKPWIERAHRLAPAANTPNLPALQAFGVQVILTPIDRRARQPGNPRHRRKPAPARRARLGRCKHPRPALIELAPHRLQAVSDAVRVDHAFDIRLSARLGNPQAMSQSDAPSAIADSVIVRSVLSA